MSTASPLAQILDSCHVVVTVGAGGVGKTTVAAALAVAAARAGKRVLCLTIDPARRLAQSLGLSEMTSDAVTVDPARFAEVGITMRGSLTAMMLDTKQTFDELIRKYAATPEKAERLLSNRLYRYVSTSLAGTQEYMAMEKLVAVKDDPRFDLVILDTPPTANALDFLDAPRRLTEALDSATMKWFVQAFESTGTFSLNLLARSAAAVFRVVGRITGGGFLESVAEFIAELNELFGGFKERAARVEAALRSSRVSFVLVTSAAPPAVREVLYFAERLAESNMKRGAFVVNRFHLPPPHAEISALDAASGLTHYGLSLGEDGPQRVVQAHHDSAEQAELDARHVRILQESAGATPVVRVDEFDVDVHDVGTLARLADVLMRGGV